LDEVRSISDIRITALQVEMHPLLQQRDLREYCGRHGITLIGYAPFGNGRIFDVPEIREIAERHGVSTAQVTLAWFRHKGVPTIPKAISKDHLRDNWRSRKLELNDEDIEEIDAISREERQYNPDYAPDW
jgi:2,5-diketo-D-gluconate reductase B